MLEGKNVNLRIMEKENLPLFAEWMNMPEFYGEYNPLRQLSKTEVEKMFETPVELKSFIIEKKDGSKIGFVARYKELWGGQMEIGYVLVPNERGKGYCSEAVQIMVDYLFLSMGDIVRIQAHTDVRNAASQKVLEKVGFKKEGTLRKSRFERGEWGDWFIYSILREEWKEPKILTKTTPKSKHK
jgi:RimJ/RimL family protein N-acetyltransferase